jgi:hypothetical protein
MKKSLGNLVCTAFATLAAGTSVLCLTQTAYAQTTWGQPEVYQHPKRLGPSQRPLTEPEGPTLSWNPLRIGVALETQTTWLQDSAARRIVGKGAPTAVGLALHYEALRPAPNLTVKLDLGWMTSSSTATQPTNSQNEESYDTNLVTLGVSLRYQLVRWMAPYARVAGGMGWDKLSVGNDSGNLDDKHKFGHAAAGGGVFLRSPGLCLRPSTASYCAAVMGHIEGGYMLGTSSTLTLHSSPASGVSNPIPTESVPIGEMSRSAPYLRVSVGIAL